MDGVVIDRSVRLWGWIGRALGDWWLRQIESSGASVGGPHSVARLSGALASSYERGLKTHIGAHSSLVTVLGLREGSAAEWTEISFRVDRLVVDLHMVSVLFAKRVHAGDEKGSVWYSDLLQRWDSEANGLGRRLPWYLEESRVPGLPMLRLPWEEVQRRLAVDAEVVGRAATAVELGRVLIRRYWADVVTTVVAVLIAWSRGSDGEPSACLVRARELVHLISPPESGSRLHEERPIHRLVDVINSILRTQILEHSSSGGTGQRLDVLLNQVAEVRDREWITGRAYEPQRLSLYDLLPSQLALAVVIAASERVAQVPAEIGERLILDVLGDAELADHALHRLQQCVEALATLRDDDLERLAAGILTQPASDDRIRAGRQNVQRLLESFLSSIRDARAERVRLAPLSATRVAQYGTVAEQALARARQAATIFRIARAVERDASLVRDLSVRVAVPRAEITDPPLTRVSDPDLSGIQQWLEGYVEAQVTLRLQSELSRTEIAVANADEYDAALTKACDDIRSHEASPTVLIVRRGQPGFVRDWMLGRRPVQGRRVERAPGNAEADLMGRWGDVPLYEATLKDGYTLVFPNHGFDSIILSGSPAEAVFEVTAKEGNDLSVDVFLRWGIRLRISMTSARLILATEAQVAPSGRSLE